MIKGISYWSFKDGLAGTHPIMDAVEEAGRERFSAIELAVGIAGAISVETSQADCVSLRKQIDRTNVQVQTVACGLSWAFNPASEDPAIRNKAIELHSAALERAAWLGATSMLMVPGVVKSPISPNETIRYDRALDRVRAAIGQLLKVADRTGVELCLENVWNGLFYSPIEFAAFIDSFSTERLGVYLDVGNLIGYQQYPPHWIELLGHRIKRVHIKDFRHSFGWTGAYSFCDLGGGDVPWPQTMAALQGIGYDKTLIAEMLPWDSQLLQRTSAAMDGLLALAK